MAESVLRAYSTLCTTLVDILYNWIIQGVFFTGPALKVLSMELLLNAFPESYILSSLHKQLAGSLVGRRVGWLVVCAQKNPLTHGFTGAPHTNKHLK